MSGREHMELEIPILVFDPVRIEGEVEVDVKCFTIDRESLIYIKRMLKEEWDPENVRKATLWGSWGKLKVSF